MRPTFMGFETARKGLMANQKGIDVTGQNLTNVQTAGYTRQRVDLVSMSVAGGGRYGVKQSTMAGQGVNVQGVAQLRDPFLDKRFREEYGDVGYYDQSTAIMDDIEAALDEVSSKGMKDAMANLMKSLQNFSKYPDQVTHANIVMTASKNMTQILKQFDTKLSNIAEQQKFNLNIAVNDVNSLFERVANLNKTISSDLFLSSASDAQSYGPNELYDQRNSLLDELSRFGDMRATENPDGTIKVEMNGQTVVDGTYFETLNMVPNQDGTVSLNWQSSGDDVVLTTGSLKAFTDMINGRGADATGMNENFEKGVLYYKDKIDTLANKIAESFNSVLMLEPKTDPITGQPLPPEYKKLFSATDPSNPHITAGNITISSEWAADPAYIIKGVAKITSTFSTTHSTIAGNLTRLTLTNSMVGYPAPTPVPAHIAMTNALQNVPGSNGLLQMAMEPPFSATQIAAGAKINMGMSGVDNVLEFSSTSLAAIGYEGKITLKDTTTGKSIVMEVSIKDDGAGAPQTVIGKVTELAAQGSDGAYDNTNILNMINLFNKDHDFGEFKGTLEEYVNFYNTGIGQQKEFNQSRFEATASIADDLLNRRDAISGVSMDEEGANLMMYDKAYKAVSRLMTAMDEALDVLINRTGLVGR